MAASDTPNIVLTGFMGTGKTTVGRLLAHQLGYEFVDTDQVIEERHGTIAELFRSRGEDAFRRIERDLATELADRQRLVISTGGRMMLDPHNVATLSRNGRVFCLVATPDEILDRIVNDTSRVERPLLSGPDPRQRIVELLAERGPGYDRFTQLSTDGLSADAVASIIAALPTLSAVTGATDGDRRAVEFTGRDMRGAQFRMVDMRDARFREVDLRGVTMRGVALVDADLDGEMDRMRIWGVEVGPLVEAELDRRHPERAVLYATEPADLRAGWAGLETMWAATLERVAGMPAGTQDLSVDEEWSFAQTLRHLVLATDAWLGRAILQQERPYHPLGVLFSEVAGDAADYGIDADATPSYAEVLEARAGRVAMVRDYLAAVTPQQLAGGRADPWGGEWKPSVLDCLRVIFDEEWHHHRYATRDLDAIDVGRGSGEAGADDCSERR